MFQLSEVRYACYSIFSVLDTLYVYIYIYIYIHTPLDDRMLLDITCYTLGLIC